MKVRVGFVSNSSSSSFTIFGACVSDHDGFEELTGMTVSDYAAKHGLCVEYGDPNLWDPCSYLGLVANGEFEHVYRSDMRDDETVGEFKQRVRSLLPEGLPEDMIGMWSESYRDG